MKKKRTAIALIGLILFMSLVAGCRPAEEKKPESKPESEVVPYVPSQIPEDLLTPVDIRQVATEAEKIKLEREGYQCLQWLKRTIGGGYDPKMKMHWESMAIFNDGWNCEKEVEAPVGISLLSKGGSFPEAVKGLSGRELEEPAEQYTIVIPQAGRLEWFYLLEGKHTFEDDWWGKGGVCHKHYDSRVVVYDSEGDIYRNYSATVKRGETIIFKVFRNLYSIHNCEDMENILDWGGLDERYWLSAKLIVEEE